MKCPPPTSFNSIPVGAIPHAALLPTKIMFDTIYFPTHYVKSDVRSKYVYIRELISVFGLSVRTSRINLTFKSFPTMPVQILDILFAPYYCKDSSMSETMHRTTVITA